jgi:hypothetical protein
MALRIRVVQFGFNPAEILLICQICSRPRGSGRKAGIEMLEGNPNKETTPKMTKENRIKVLWMDMAFSHPSLISRLRFRNFTSVR